MVAMDFGPPLSPGSHFIKTIIPWIGGTNTCENWFCPAIAKAIKLYLLCHLVESCRVGFAGDVKVQKPLDRNEAKCDLSCRGICHYKKWWLIGVDVETNIKFADGFFPFISGCPPIGFPRITD